MCSQVSIDEREGGIVGNTYMSEISHQIKNDKSEWLM